MQQVLLEEGSKAVHSTNILLIMMEHNCNDDDDIPFPKLLYKDYIELFVQEISVLIH